MAEQDAVHMDDAANSILSLLDTEDGAGDAGDTGAETKEIDTGDEPSKDAQARIEKALDEPEVKADAKADAKTKDEKGADTETKGEAETPADKAQVDPPIEPPVSWKADAKERFKALPPDTQKDIVSRESEREAFLTKTREEAKREVTTARQAVDKERETFTKHVQTHSQQIDSLFKMLRASDPVIAEGDKTDWDAALASDPNAAAKRTRYELRLNALAAQAKNAFDQVREAEAETKKLSSAKAQEQFAKAVATLNDHPDLGPIWKDPQKRQELQAGVDKFLETQGLAEHERVLTDPRELNIARMAMERASQTVPYAELQKKAEAYDKLMSEQTKIAEKKKPATAMKVVRPQASEDEGETDDKMKAALSRARKTGRLDEKAAAIANAL